MLTDDTRLQFAAERAATKVIDGDAIIIDTVSGRYYSLEGPGEAAWSLLRASLTLAEVAAALQERYDTGSSDVLGDIRRLATELVDENLLRIAPPDSVSSPAQAARGPRAPYTPPSLVVFRDLEDMLAFDPPLPHPAEGAAWGIPTQGEP